MPRKISGSNWLLLVNGPAGLAEHRSLVTIWSDTHGWDDVEYDEQVPHSSQNTDVL